MMQYDSQKKALKETKHKYIHLKKLYCKLLAIHKHVEEELHLAQKELLLETEKNNPGADKIIAALKKQNEELRRLNSTKDMLFSIIGHDLKSPFNSVIGFSKILHERLKQNNIEDSIRISEIIFQSANNAMELLRDLLEWALMKTGKMEFHAEPNNLLVIVEQVERLFFEIADQKNITIQKDIPGDFIIRGDKEMLEVIMRNLISNALKFSKPGGSIKISAKHVSNEDVISVADSGIGIPADKQDSLFDIEKIHTDSGKGLGLVLCKEFVEKHNGKIWMESKENQGSTFYFSLPVDSL
ncbi:MAG: sensor histidine kinase [Bacteroidota bacterium]